MSRPHAKPKAVILGAGIQGVSVALALDRAGWQAELIDRAPAPMLRTSLSGEGKLHLGYVYGNEPERATARLMAEGALSFAELLDRWLPEPIDWAALRSEPFVYAILAGSMVPPSQLAAHYRWVDELVMEGFEHGATYAGTRTFSPSDPLDCLQQAGFAGDVVAAYQTREIAVDPVQLRRSLITGIGARDIACVFDCVVNAVERRPHGFEVTATNGSGEVITRRGDAVVNCLWDGRVAIDATLGIPPDGSCYYRLKHAVHGTIAAQRIPSMVTTFALGPFGDVVCWPDGRVYLSWYPVCRTEASTDIEPPSSWRPSTERPFIDDGADTMSTSIQRDIAQATVAALADRIPVLRGVHIGSVSAGVVVAKGGTDIDQPDSALHRRHEIGVHDYDGYLSVDTGKFTTAPFFADRVVEVLEDARVRSV